MPPKAEPAPPAKKRPAKAPSASAPKDQGVASFMADLDHPLKQEIEAVRQIILGASPEIREGIQWNAPSFRTTDFFATFNLRARDRVQLVFHMGAKVKATATTGITLEDPAGLLEWRAKDRALVTLGVDEEIKAKRAAFEALVRAWIQWL